MPPIRATSVLSTADYIVLLVYVSAILATGAAFYRRQSNVRDYFVAGRSTPTIVIVIGLAASLTSCISYLGVPSYAFRVNLVPLATLIASPIALWIVARVFLPFFFRLDVLTSYEYLERRFSRGIRLLASSLFLVSRYLWLVLVSYGSAAALRFAIPVALPAPVAEPLRSLRIDPVIVFWVLVIGVVTSAFTMAGGMRAVMWTDLAQFTMLTCGLIGVVLVAVSSIGMSPGQIWSVAAQAGRTKMFNFSFNWTSDTFWAALCGGIFLTLGDFGIDQIAAQRYLSAKSLRQSQRSAFLSLAVNIPFSLLLYGVGIVLFAYYQKLPSENLQTLLRQNPDGLLPYFFFEKMPRGVLGLMLATILAATMSCMSSGINSLSASSIMDIYVHARRRSLSPQELVAKGRLVTMAWGMAIALGAAWASSLGAGLMELSWTFLGLSATINIGIFLAAMLLPRAGAAAVWSGAIAGAAVSAGIVLAGFHWLWFYTFGALAGVAVAAITSLFFKPPDPECIRGLTYWTRSEPTTPSGSSGGVLDNAF